jgi:hypothetical protein
VASKKAKGLKMPNHSGVTFYGTGCFRGGEAVQGRDGEGGVGDKNRGQGVINVRAGERKVPAGLGIA